MRLRGWFLLWIDSCPCIVLCLVSGNRILELLFVAALPGLSFVGAVHVGTGSGRKDDLLVDLHQVCVWIFLASPLHPQPGVDKEIEKSLEGIKGEIQELKDIIARLRFDLLDFDRGVYALVGKGRGQCGPKNSVKIHQGIQNGLGPHLEDSLIRSTGLLVSLEPVGAAPPKGRPHVVPHQKGSHKAGNRENQQPESSHGHNESRGGFRTPRAIQVLVFVAGPGIGRVNAQIVDQGRRIDGLGRHRGNIEGQGNAPSNDMAQYFRPSLKVLFLPVATDH